MLRVLLLLLLLLTSAQAQTPEELAEGGYVIYFRHTSATLGADCKDPSRGEWWKSGDPNLSKQLDAQGKAQAARIGKAFRRLGIEVDGVFCSEFNRARETALAMNLAPVVHSRALTPLAYPGRMEERLAPLFNRTPQAGKNTVLVAHGHVTELFEDLGQGDAAVFKPGAQPLFRGFVRLKSWEEAARVQGAFMEVRRFPAPEATQAVAVGKDHVFAIDNAQIGKYDKKTGQRVGLVESSQLTHMNSGVVLGGKLFCAHSSWPHQPWVSSIEAWDPLTLRHLGSHSFGLQDGALNWIDRRGESYWGVFVHYHHDAGNTHPLYVGRSRLIRFDNRWRPLESWAFPKSLLDKFRPATNSGGAWGSDGLLYVTGHDHGEVYRLRLPAAGSVLEEVDSLKAPITGQGIAWDPFEKDVLWGIDRPARALVKMKFRAR